MMHVNFVYHSCFAQPESWEPNLYPVLIFLDQGLWFGRLSDWSNWFNWFRIRPIGPSLIDLVLLLDQGFGSPRHILFLISLLVHKIHVTSPLREPLFFNYLALIPCSWDLHFYVYAIMSAAKWSHMPESTAHWLARWYMFIYVCLCLSSWFVPPICIMLPLVAHTHILLVHKHVAAPCLPLSFIVISITTTISLV